MSAFASGWLTGWKKVSDLYIAHIHCVTMCCVVLLGAVAIATLNRQVAVADGQEIPDAWHHQMIYGVSPKGTLSSYLTYFFLLNVSQIFVSWKLMGIRFRLLSAKKMFYFGHIKVHTSCENQS